MSLNSERPKRSRAHRLRLCVTQISRAGGTRRTGAKCARGCCPRRCVDVRRESEKGVRERRVLEEGKGDPTLDQFRSERESKPTILFLSVMSPRISAFPLRSVFEHAKTNKDRGTDFRAKNNHFDILFYFILRNLCAMGIIK